MLSLLIWIVAATPMLFIFILFIPLILHYEEKCELVPSSILKLAQTTLLLSFSMWLTGGTVKVLFDQGKGGSPLFYFFLGAFLILPTTITAFTMLRTFAVLTLWLRLIMTISACIITYPVLYTTVFFKYIAIHGEVWTNLGNLKLNWFDIIIWSILGLVLTGWHKAGSMKNKRLLPLLANFFGALFILLMAIK